MSLERFIPELQNKFGLCSLKSKRPPLVEKRQAAQYILKFLLAKDSCFPDKEIQDVQIKRSSTGKPFLSAKTTKSFPLPEISISHANRWVSCLLSSPQSALGLDIEYIAPNRPFKQIAAYAFTKNEMAYVNSHKEFGFYQLWTAKEALAKSNNKNLLPLFQVDLTPFLSPFKRVGTFKIIYEGKQLMLYQHLDEEKNLFISITLEIPE